MSIFNNLNQNFHQFNENLNFIEEEFNKGTGPDDLLEINNKIDASKKILNTTEYLVRLSNYKEELKKYITSNNLQINSNIQPTEVKNDEDFKNRLSLLGTILKNETMLKNGYSVSSLQIKKMEEYLQIDIETILSTIQSIEKIGKLKLEELSRQLSQFEVKNLFGRVKTIESCVNALKEKIDDFVFNLKNGKGIEEFNQEQLDSQLEEYRSEIEKILNFVNTPCISNIFKSIQEINNAMGNENVPIENSNKIEITQEQFFNVVRQLKSVINSSMWKKKQIIQQPILEKVQVLNDYLGLETKEEALNPDSSIKVVISSTLDSIKNLMKEISKLSAPIEYSEVHESLEKLMDCLYSNKSDKKAEFEFEATEKITRFLNQNPIQKLLPEIIRYFIHNSDKFIKNKNFFNEIKTFINSPEALSLNTDKMKNLKLIQEKITRTLSQIDGATVRNKQELYQILQEMIKANFPDLKQSLIPLIPPFKTLSLPELNTLNDYIFCFLQVIYSILNKENKSIFFNETFKFGLTDKWYIFRSNYDYNQFKTRIMPDYFRAFIIHEVQKMHGSQAITPTFIQKMVMLLRGLPFPTDFYDSIKNDKFLWITNEYKGKEEFEKAHTFLFNNIPGLTSSDSNLRNDPSKMAENEKAVSEKISAKSFEDYLTDIFISSMFEIESIDHLVINKLTQTVKGKISAILNTVDSSNISPDELKKMLLNDPYLKEVDQEIFISALQQISQEQITNHPFTAFESLDWREIFNTFTQKNRIANSEDNKNAYIKFLKIIKDFSKNDIYFDRDLEDKFKKFKDKFNLDNLCEEIFLNPLIKAKVCEEICADFSQQKPGEQIDVWIEKANLWLESSNSPSKPLSSIFDFFRQNPSEIGFTYLGLYLGSNILINIKECEKYQTKINNLINKIQEEPVPELLKEAIINLSNEFSLFTEELSKELITKLSSQNTTNVSIEEVKDGYKKIKNNINTFYTQFKDFFSCEKPEELPEAFTKIEPLLNQYPKQELYFRGKFNAFCLIHIKKVVQTYPLSNEEQSFIIKILNNYWTDFSKSSKETNLSLKEVCEKYQEMLRLLNSLPQPSTILETNISNIKNAPLIIQKISCVIIQLFFRNTIKNKFYNHFFKSNSSPTYFIKYLSSEGFSFTESFFEDYSFISSILLNPQTEFNSEAFLLELHKRSHRINNAFKQIEEIEIELENITDTFFYHPLLASCYYLNAEHARIFKKIWTSYLEKIFDFDVKPQDSSSLFPGQNNSKKGSLFLKELRIKLEELKTNFNKTILETTNLNYIIDYNYCINSFDIENTLFEMLTSIFSIDAPKIDIRDELYQLAIKSENSQIEEGKDELKSPATTSGKLKIDKKGVNAFQFVKVANDFYHTIKKMVRSETDINSIFLIIERLFYKYANCPLYLASNISQISQNFNLETQIENFKIAIKLVNLLDLTNKSGYDSDSHKEELKTIFAGKEKKQINLSREVISIPDQIGSAWNKIKAKVPTIRNINEKECVEKQFFKIIKNILKDPNLPLVTKNEIIEIAKGVYFNENYLKAKGNLLANELLYNSTFYMDFYNHVELRTEFLFGILGYYSKIAPFFKGLGYFKLFLSFEGKKYINASGPKSANIVANINNKTLNMGYNIRAHVAHFQNIETELGDSILSFLVDSKTAYLKTKSLQNQRIQGKAAASVFQRIDFIKELVTTIFEENVRRRLPTIIRNLLLHQNNIADDINIERSEIKKLKHLALKNAKIEVIKVFVGLLNNLPKFIYSSAFRINNNLRGLTNQRVYNNCNQEIVFQHFRDALKSYYTHISQLIKDFKLEDQVYLISPEQFEFELEVEGEGGIRQKVYDEVQLSKLPRQSQVI